MFWFGLITLLDLAAGTSIGSNWTPDMQDHVPGEPLSPQDYQNGDALSAAYHVNSLSQTDPIELAGLFEGDIILQPDFINNGSETDNNNATRNAIVKETQKWQGGVVPYIISAQFNPLERSVFARAFLDYQRQTCITFRPRSTETDFIHIMKGNGCSSHVGRTGGDQPVVLGNGCVYTGIATHELMHALGFWHEQSRWDRDQYIDVHTANIASGMDFNFNKYSWQDIQNLSAPYDTGSILHYGRFAFSKNKNLPTITPKSPNDRMGQRDGLSKTDIWKINKLYNCFGASPTNSPATATTTVSSTTPQSAQVGKCVDSHKYCYPWSEKGECTKNPAWMLQNCKQSCNNCDPKCMDSNQYCVAWQQAGECGRNPQYMHTYCAKTCGVCVNEMPTPDVDVPDVTESSSPLIECVDKNELCSDWAKKGECKSNPKYMLTSCRKSCNICLKLEDVGGSETENPNDIISNTI